MKFISNTDHYKEVLSRVQSVKHMLWIGTADIKDLYVEVVKKRKSQETDAIFNYIMKEKELSVHSLL